MQAKRSAKIDSIQMLRAVAAILVVVHHTLRAYTNHAPGYMRDLTESAFAFPWFRDGLGSGVDIFFIISGFIMVYVSRDHAEGQKSPMDFLRLRAERIYPPYIIATIFLIFLVFASTRTLPSDYSLWRISASLTLLPSFDANGLVQPILGVGWTLSYEMYFYLSFAVALAIGRQRYMPVLSAIIAVAWLVASMINSSSALGVFFANPITFEFLFGCWIAFFYQANKLPRFHPLFIFPAIVSIIAAMYLHLPGVWRPIYWGLPGAVIFIAVLSLQDNQNTFRRIVVFLGDASYSIYLIHILVIYYVAARFYPKLISLGLVASIDQAVLMTSAACICFGVLYHLIVEKKIIRWVQRLRKSENRALVRKA
ncbi:acyltransferase 3 protein [Rhizobium etli bv. phaseoli str. IE4803]|nr:acyltransferase 3 protein [Rhizobium etli bv. phaseoli str. IE4803]